MRNNAAFMSGPFLVRVGTDPYSRKHGPILMTFSRQVGPNLTSRLPLNIAKIEKSKHFQGKTLPNGLPKYVKTKAPYLLSFPGKMITFCPFCTIFGRKQGLLKCQRVRINI